jgi:hypothetical protein
VRAAWIPLFRNRNQILWPHSTTACAGLPALSRVLFADFRVSSHFFTEKAGLYFPVALQHDKIVFALNSIQSNNRKAVNSMRMFGGLNFDDEC